MKKFWFLNLVCLLALSAGCDQQKKTPSAPPVPDIPLPAEPDVAAAATGDAGTAPRGGSSDGGMHDPRSPIPSNLIEYIPEVLAGVKARRRQVVKTAPIVHGFYKAPKNKMYNVHLTGPNQTEEQRRAMYPLLGKDETEDHGPRNLRGFEIGDWQGQRTYHTKTKKSEAVLLVNPFVEVKVSASPADDPDEAIKLLDEIDLEGVSNLR